MTISVIEREIERLRRTNRNAARHGDAFANHRRHLTGLLLSAGGQDAQGTPDARNGKGRLCVLGAGNALDLDLERLAATYRAIHLVDIDEQALERARERQTESTRARLVTHSPIDLSGLLDQLQRWHAMQATAEELVRHPDLASRRLAAALSGPFDVVLSACVLSQMQLAVRTALSETHPLFAAVCYTLNLTHLRTLARLTQRGGRALLVSDAATEEMAPLRELDDKADLRQLLAHLIRVGDVFNVVNPEAIIDISTDDPMLKRELGFAHLTDVWLWHNGPLRTYLVYALELQRL
jgi:hypothetical protein